MYLVRIMPFGLGGAFSFKQWLSGSFFRYHFTVVLGRFNQMSPFVSGRGPEAQPQGVGRAAGAERATLHGRQVQHQPAAGGEREEHYLGFDESLLH